MLVLIAAPALAGAQTPADSIPEWTRALQTGPLLSRDSALARLATIPIADLPPETQRALIGELNRMHAAILSETSLPSEEESDVEPDYYMTLVTSVTRLPTPDAALALAPAVSVSAGVARRVARAGDPVIDVLLQLLPKRYEENSVLGTLGLAWFWADSTQTPLSDASRAKIVGALASAVTSTSVNAFLGAARAMEYMKDPAFLPLASLLRDRARSTDAYTEFLLSRRVIPMLTTTIATIGTERVATDIERVIAGVCGTRASGRRLGTCESISHDFAESLSQLKSGRTAAARAGLESVHKRSDQAFERGDFNEAEHSLVSGGVAILLGRLQQ